MITFNHEEFIAEAIESVLRQKTNFPFELIIGEDCSTDFTRSICIEYKKKYPDIIRLQLPDSNKGMMRNFIENMQAARGNYIALCEGDDFWIDCYKLQKQVDFLEQNDDYIACFHNARVVNKYNQISLFNSLNEMQHPTKEEILSRKWFIATASLMFRNKVIDFPNWMYEVVNGDYALELLLALKGEFYYMHDVMSAYRQHEMSISRDLNRRKIFLYAKLIELYNEISKIYPPKYNDLINQKIHSLQLSINKEQKMNDYPFLKYLNWRFYKRILFRLTRLQRVPK